MPAAPVPPLEGPRCSAVAQLVTHRRTDGHSRIKTTLSQGSQWWAILDSIGNTGSEEEMRRELAEAVGGVIAGMRTEVEPLSDVEVDHLLDAADLVTRARTGVDFDYQDKVIDSHAPEMPTGFAKQLGQVIRGAAALGVGRTEALRLAIRCARDSMPPLRLVIIDDVAKHPESTPSEVRKRVEKPWTTIDRQMQALHMLEVLDCERFRTGR
jgi:hypothetical protein